MQLEGVVKAICISTERGTEKHAIEQANFIVDYGIEGDAHAGKWHRQVSLLSYNKVEEFNAKGGNVEDGAFGENVLVSGLDFKNLPVGTILKCGEVVLEMTQIGKECHSHCNIFHRVGDCIMPREGVFAIVKAGGIMKIGDVMVAELPEAEQAAATEEYLEKAKKDVLHDMIVYYILEAEGKTYNKSQCYLSYNLVFAAQAVLVLLEYLY